MDANTIREAPVVSWCEEHAASWSIESAMCDLALWRDEAGSSAHTRCRMVEKVLVEPEAARLYADLLENGEKVWCVTHDAESIENHGGMTDECWRVVWVTDGEPEAASDLRDFCRMTSVRVVPVSTTEER